MGEKNTEMTNLSSNAFRGTIPGSNNFTFSAVLKCFNKLRKNTQTLFISANKRYGTSRT